MMIFYSVAVHYEELRKLEAFCPRLPHPEIAQTIVKPKNTLDLYFTVIKMASIFTVQDILASNLLLKESMGRYI